MNRLVIIGNGFDLAHGLPTSYKNFIDDYWEGIQNSEYKDDFISFENKSRIEFKSNKNLCDLSKYFIAVDEQVKFSEGEIYREYGNNFLNGKYPRAHILNYKNVFFRLINQKSIQNWVDIENEYYKQLKGIVNLKPENSLVNEDEFEISRKEKIFRLNKEFEQVKKLLENYLLEKVFHIFNFDEYKDLKGDMLKFPHLFKPISYKDESEEMMRFLDEFPKSNQEDIKNQFIFRGDKLVADCETTFLNFNYTPTLWNYSNILRGWNVSNDIIYIHGHLKDDVNKINFGFGDEKDDDYKMIENIDDNEYLRNFKSFQYLYSSNYKKLLNLIDSDNYQVYIMGHSCGLSDRTLLNTIFEHKNCCSIKVFFYQEEDEDGNVIKDNYTEITQNISRHFNDKKLMRSKIVNKTLCQPLPQIKLPKK